MKRNEGVAEIIDGGRVIVDVPGSRRVFDRSKKQRDNVREATEWARQNGTPVRWTEDHNLR